jgi:Flp pilus assembly protein TadD
MSVAMKLCVVPFVIGMTLLTGCQDSSRMLVAAPSGPNTSLARQLDDQAYALIKQEKYEQAEPLLHKAIDADVTFGPARNNLGLVYFHAKKLYPAAWEFQNAIRLMPYQPEPRNNLGLVLESAGKMTDAAEAYEKARKMEPDNPQYIGNLARVRIEQGIRDDETKKLLQELVFKDSRPTWRDWAQLELVRFYAKPIEPVLPGSTKATQPSKP